MFLNGKEVFAREEYHHGRWPDQYVARARLKEGRNELLLKVCQNEQSEVWAQDWNFQVRLCDPIPPGDAQVLEIGGQGVEGGLACVARHERPLHTSEVREVLGVAPPSGGAEFGQRIQPFRGVFPDRLEHEQPRFARARVRLPNEALVEQ